MVWGAREGQELYILTMPAPGCTPNAINTYGFSAASAPGASRMNVSKSMVFRNTLGAYGIRTCLHALQHVGCNLGAIWAIVFSRCLKMTHGAWGIRVFGPSLDSAKCEFGCFEIWVPQKYARRLGNTCFLQAPRCNLRRPGSGQNLHISRIRAAPRE